MTNPAEQFTKTAQQNIHDINSFARESWDIAVKSAAAASKGWEETARSANGLMQENFARAVTASKTILGAKSLREMMDLHAEFVKDSFDHFIASTSKITELSSRVTKDAIEPVTEHASATISKIMHKSRAA